MSATDEPRLSIGDVVFSPGNGRYPGGRYRIDNIGWQHNGLCEVEFAYLVRLDNGAPRSKPPGSRSKVAIGVLSAWQRGTPFERAVRAARVAGEVAP